MTELELIAKAREAQRQAYAPYSDFHVGAALLTGCGKIYTGCNIENGAFSPTVCAERTAFFKAISEGERDFRAIAVVGASGSGEYRRFCPPCGVCRQVMAEFCGPDFQIILGDGTENYELRTLAELLPESFAPPQLHSCPSRP